MQVRGSRYGEIEPAASSGGRRGWLLALASLTLLGSCAAPEPARVDVAVPRSEGADERGGALFSAYCSRCHGVDARGTTIQLAGQRTEAPDLTTFGMRHGGFRVDSVASFVDGRVAVAGHPDRQMPVWGRTLDDRLEVSLEEELKLTPQMISDIVDHLALLQRWE